MRAESRRLSITRCLGRVRARMVFALLVAAAGCEQFPTFSTHDQAKREAQDRWSNVRGRLKYQLAHDQFTAGRVDQSEKQLREAISLDPDLPEAFILLTKIHLERGETLAASEALHQAVGAGGETAETEYLKGMIAQRYERFDEALACYRRAAEGDPKNAHYVATIAETLVALDRATEALALIRERSTDFEQNATIRSLAGGIYMMLGRYEEAADAYREAVQIAPEDRVLQSQLGLALALSDQYQEARRVLAPLVDDEPDAAGSILLALGRCELQLGEPERAKQVLQRAVNAEPINPRYWTWLARAALASNDFMTARRAAGQAKRLAPESAEHAMLLGFVCWRQEDYPAAAEALEQGNRLEPGEPMTLCLLGQTRASLGDHDAAKLCYTQALEADPKCEWARRLLDETAPSPPLPLSPSASHAGDDVDGGTRSGAAGEIVKGEGRARSP